MATDSPVKSSDAPAGPAGPRLTLRVRDEMGQTRQVELTEPRVVIGRSDEAGLILERQTVSRRHAELTCQSDGSWVVADLGSRAGTTVNGDSLEQPHVLKPGDEIGISRFQLTVVCPAEHAAEAKGRSGIDRVTGHASNLEPVDDASQISVLTNITPPKVDTSHIAQLSDFGKQLIDTPDPQARLNALCQVMAGQVILARWVMALRVDGDDPARPPEQLAVYPADITDQANVHLSRSAIRAMQEAGAPVLASNFDSAANSVELSVVSQQPATAVVVCPLTDDPQSREMLYVNLPPAFGSTEWLALIALAVKQYQQAEAAWALQEATRKQAAIEKELEHARLIQRSILPAGRAIEGFELAWSFEPCDRVGGDVLDVLTLPDGRLMLVIADVTGHGLPAALATLSVHSIIHTAVRTDAPLPRMMELLNVHLCDYLPADRFVTMACVAIDPATGDVEYLNAGHHGPTLFDTNGRPHEWSDGDHFPLGVSTQSFNAMPQTLDPGQTLLLSTDGLIELPVGDGQLLGRAAGDELVGSALTSITSLEDAVQAIRSQLTERRDGDAVDDETYLLVRRV